MTASLSVTWLGQAGFLLDDGRTSVAIDPFLSAHEGRATPPVWPADRLASVDLILCTHEHLDHFDAETVRSVLDWNPNARVAVPEPMIGQLESEGIDPARAIGAVDGDRLPETGIPVDVVPAMHGRAMEDAYGFGPGWPDVSVSFVGYVVELAGIRFYHSGDTVRWDGHAERIAALGADIVALPINGRDEEREAEDIVGNLDATEAWQLAADIDARVLIPMHWDAMEGNLGDPNEVLELAAEYAGPHVVVPDAGATIRFTRDGASLAVS